MWSAAKAGFDKYNAAMQSDVRCRILKTVHAIMLSSLFLWAANASLYVSQILQSHSQSALAATRHSYSPVQLLNVQLLHFINLFQRRLLNPRNVDRAPNCRTVSISTYNIPSAIRHYLLTVTIRRRYGISPRLSSQFKHTSEHFWILTRRQSV